MSATTTDTYSRGSWTRTVVVSGVPDVLPASRMVDKLVIHFQSRRSCGGDVKLVTYPTNMPGVAFVTFDQTEDAERVVLKEQQVMTDDEFPADYLLTVFPFSRDVFLYVPSAVVDLSVFGRDQSRLIESLRTTHRSLRFRPLVQQMKVTIEGPFAAVQALRRDLIHRAELTLQTTGEVTGVQSLVSDNLKASSRQKDSCDGSATGSWCDTNDGDEEQRGRSRLSLSRLDLLLGSTKYPGDTALKLNSKYFKSDPEAISLDAAIQALRRDLILRAEPTLQTTGEATRVQSLVSDAQKASSRQEVSCDGSATGSLCDTNNDNEKQRGRSRSSLSHLDFLSSSTKYPGYTGLKHDSKSSKSDPEAMSPDDPEDDPGDLHNGPDDDPDSDLDDDLDDPDNYPDDICVWVDSYTFRYIEKFYKDEFDKRLRALDASVEHKDAELTRISSTGTIQHSLEDLKSLLENWQRVLRVRRIDFEKEEKQEVLQICQDANFLYDDVLYISEDSCVKVVGPSVSLYLFCKTVEHRAVGLKA